MRSSVSFAISAILMHAYYSNSNANFSNYNSDKKNRENCKNQTFALVVIIWITEIQNTH